MSRIDVVSLVGSAVPAELRSDGHMACWLVLVDGQPKAGPFASREAALACQAVWMLSSAIRREGDSLLACSDGLWHYFTPKELGAILHALPPREASEMLVGKARQRARGGGDNLSLAILRIEPIGR